MSMRGRVILLLVAAALVTLAVPASAFAHAALLQTSPQATGTAPRPPAQVTLTYSEAIEPRFAIISVTDSAGRQQTAGAPTRSPASPDAIVVPLHRVPEGWYLVYWRVISADGHPVRGAFTFAVGPNPGPAPQFVIPSLSETAATPSLLVARWVMFLGLMAAIGLFCFRVLIARPLARVVPQASLRGVSVALLIALGVALVATPVYLVLATAQFALRPATDLSALLPLVRASSFGRALVDLEIGLGLFALAVLLVLALDRPSRRMRSGAELLALLGALAAAAALLIVPGLAGHAAQTSPAWASLSLDWVHLAAGSIWLGGLIGLLVVWWRVPSAFRVAALGRLVPRFSRVAFTSVMLLLASGVVASIIHLPTLGALWQTSYGVSILIKAGLLGLAMMLAGVNLVRTRPRLAAAAARKDEPLGQGAAVLLRRLVSGEVAIVIGILFVAGILSSLPPPSKALGEIGRASAQVGPGQVARVVQHGPYRLAFTIAPNRAALPNSFAVRITKDGQPVHGAQVVTSFAMLDMDMPQQAYTLAEQSPGLYERHSTPALVMAGHWGLDFEVTPPGETPFDVIVVDRAGG